MILRNVKEQDFLKIIEVIFEGFDAKGKSFVINLIGDLGAGKTTFVKYLAKYFGIKENVLSPTFVFMREYEIKNNIFQKLYHIDAYRFENEKEGEILELNELKKKNNLIVIEWPQKINHNKAHLEITFLHKDENLRDLKIKYAKQK